MQITNDDCITMIDASFVHSRSTVCSKKRDHIFDDKLN